MVSAFLDASSRGDLQALLRLLDPSVVFRADGGGKVPAAQRPVTGKERVAQVVLAGREWYPGMTGSLVTVNRGQGLLMVHKGQVIAITGITVSRGLITVIDVVVNPEKLAPARGLASPSP